MGCQCAIVFVLLCCAKTLVYVQKRDTVKTGNNGHIVAYSLCVDGQCRDCTATIVADLSS